LVVASYKNQSQIIYYYDNEVSEEIIRVVFVQVGYRLEVMKQNLLNLEIPDTNLALESGVSTSGVVTKMILARCNALLINCSLDFFPIKV